MSKNKASRNIVRILTLLIATLCIAVIPLMVRIYMLESPLTTLDWHTSDPIYFDIFTFVKSQVMLVIGFISFILILYNQVRYKVYQVKDPVIIISILLSTTILISHLLSINHDISGYGAPGRYEGTWIWLSYISIFLLIYGQAWEKGSLKVLLLFFIISNTILSVIGVFQYFGINILFNDLTKPFITSFGMSDVDYSTYSKIDYKVIIQTLDHYNYVGFLLSLSFPIILSLALYEKIRIAKIAYLCLILLMFFNLIGSSARGGLVGIMVSLPFFFFFNRHLIFKNYKIVISVVLLVSLTFAGFEWYSGGFLTSRLKSIFTTIEAEKTITDIRITDNTIEFDLKTGYFKLVIDTTSREQWLVNYYLDDIQIQPLLDTTNNALYFEEPRLSGIKIMLSKFDLSTLLVVNTYGEKWHFGYNTADHLSYVNLFGKFDIIKTPESWGFEGNERMGSSRGYIWSRSIPLILNKPLLGYGPDTFVTVFPQQDYVGKYHAYYTTNMTVDKAHNIFIQIAINSGVFSLILYFSLFILVIIRNGYFKMLHFKFTNQYQAAFTISIISYFVASFFNDSTVHVSPVFWVIIALLLNKSIITSTLE